jgi:hypothetical protein
MAAADRYVAHQREFALQPDDQPDVVIGDDKCDMFWYVKDLGTDGVDRLYLVEHAGWMWCGGWGGGRNMAITRFGMMVLSCNHVI